MALIPDEKRSLAMDKCGGKHGNIDVLYHIGFDTSMDLSVFKDVRFVCMGGSPVRAQSFAVELQKQLSELGIVEKTSAAPEAVGKTERHSLYKVGPILSASHGIGMPSMLTLLHEVAKLLHYAGAKNEDVTFIRIGTSGGIGSEPGTIIVSTAGCMGTLDPVYESIELGERKYYGAELNTAVRKGLVSAANQCSIPVVEGMTMGTDDFYDCQGRLDGAVRTWYTEEDKMRFLQKAYNAGIRNIEMEAPAFGAFCNRAGIKGALVCCSIVNRLKGDQISSTPAQLGQFSVDAQTVVSTYMKNILMQDRERESKRARHE